MNLEYLTCGSNPWNPAHIAFRVVTYTIWLFGFFLQTGTMVGTLQKKNRNNGDRKSSRLGHDIIIQKVGN